MVTGFDVQLARGQVIDPDHGMGVRDIGRFCIGFAHLVFRPRTGGAKGDRIYL
jgi:hypothetical protein